MVNKFLARFYPPQRVNRLRTDVQTFSQQDGKILYEAWERYKDLTRRCPPDMFNQWVQLHIFYEGLSYESKKALDHSSRGSLNKKKTIEEAIDVIETMANNEYFYVSDRSNNRRVIELNHMNTILAQNKMITKQLADLTKQMEKNQPAAIHTHPSAQAELNTKEEVTGNKPITLGILQDKPMSHTQKLTIPVERTTQTLGGETNKTKAKIIDFTTPTNSTTPLTNMPTNDHIKPHKTILPNHQTKPKITSLNIPFPIHHLRIGYPGLKSCLKSFTRRFRIIEHSRMNFPSDTEKNPRGEMKKVRWEECKAITIASEEDMEEEISRPSEHTQGVSKEKMEEAAQMTSPEQRKEPKEKEVFKPYVPQAPFPQRLRGGEKEKIYTRFLDVFKSLHVNIPFLETSKRLAKCNHYKH
ncbi:uncharacterized protein LOC107480682 [Arachis duranensis]|uniref:Uncharacterized protein LOC107480682 n=1 Tax=Arachis duranensis TaxID=130453 RepID=A0A6P4CT74_ARADU|nr:uncharacterized protein LOC107480682 [Arachis duranensis]